MFARSKYSYQSLPDSAFPKLLSIDRDTFDKIVDETMNNMTAKGINIDKTFDNMKGVKVDILSFDPESEIEKYLSMEQPNNDHLQRVKHKVQDLMFEFYYKSTSNRSFAASSIEHKYTNYWSRVRFHTGRILLHLYFAPNHEGLSHLSQRDILSDVSHIFLATINEFISPPATLIFDGFEQKMDRFQLFGPQYTHYSNYKKMTTRKNMMISLCCHLIMMVLSIQTE